MYVCEIVCCMYVCAFESCMPVYVCISKTLKRSEKLTVLNSVETHFCGCTKCYLLLYMNCFHGEE